MRRQGTHQREFKPYVVRLAKLLRKRAKVSSPPTLRTRSLNDGDKWLPLLSVFVQLLIKGFCLAGGSQFTFMLHHAPLAEFFPLKYLF